MRKVFTSNVTAQTILVRDALERDGLEVTLQNVNESLSPVPGFSPPAEIWAMHDADYARAQRIVNATMATITRQSALPEWVCAHCHESNPPAFEICWNCGTEKSGGAAGA